MTEASITECFRVRLSSAVTGRKQPPLPGPHIQFIQPAEKRFFSVFFCSIVLLL